MRKLISRYGFEAFAGVSYAEIGIRCFDSEALGVAFMLSACICCGAVYGFMRALNQ